MKVNLAALALAGALAVAPVPSAAAEIYTIGDSHCREIARLMKWKTLARNGASISELPAQLVRLPFGAFVIACAGTNDSGSMNGVSAAPFYTQAALDVADWRGQKLVFVGPSAVRRKKWETPGRFIDADLAGLLLAKRIPYISIFEDPAMQPGKDGVHLRADQYRALGETGALQLHD